MNQKYEIVLIVDPDQDEAGVDAQVAKVTEIVKAHDGEVERLDNWGRRQLAYPIKKKEYGTYVVIIANGNSGLVAALNRHLRIVDEMLRFLVVYKDKYAPDFVPKAKEEGRPERRGGERGGDRGGDRGKERSARGRPSRSDDGDSEDRPKAKAEDTSSDEKAKTEAAASA